MLSISWRILRIFSDLWAATFSEIDQFVFEKWSVLFLFDNFRVHRFLHKKTSRKIWFFCVFRIPNVISLKRKSLFKFFWIPGSFLRPPGVRLWNENTLKSACFWKSQKLLKNSQFYCVSKDPIEYASPGVVLGHTLS